MRAWELNEETGQSLVDIGYEYKYVTIYRAVPADVTSLESPNDKVYVTRSLKFAKEHADHVAAVDNVQAHVIKAVVEAKDVYEAYNPGEYWYDGPKPKKMSIVYNAEPEVYEAAPLKLTTHDKLWVNAEKKQVIDVPTEKHHMQFAYEHPEKFGLSGNLFKEYDYPLDSIGKPMAYDEKVATAMYNAGWARVNADPPEVSIQCMDLKQCAATLRVVKQKYNDIDRAYIDIGAEMSPSEHYDVYNDEFGKGSFRTFMRTGKIT